jgi:triacylglycerol lipase
MISELTLNKQSLLMAKLSSLAYTDNVSFDGYDSKFLDKQGTQAYFLYDKDDIIIVCRGTQPTQFSDIAADVKFALVPSSSKVGLVHRGFKDSVDLIWDELSKLIKKYGSNRRVWCTGHSLGAAMATLITTRCCRTEGIKNPVLFTFGSPKVGNGEYVGFMQGLDIQHYRWVNNEDIVTRNPIGRYTHHGELHYFDHNGNLSVLNWWQTTKDRVKGFWTGIKKGKINFFVNHEIGNYIKNLEKLN